MYLEESHVGAVTELGPIEVDGHEIVEFARRYDPQFFHIDPEAAARSPYGGIIASGWHTCAMVMRVLVDGYLGGPGGLGSPGVDELRWMAPVRPGDRLRVTATVRTVRPSHSKPDRGVVQTEVVARNQDDVPVMSMVATTLVLREPGQPS